MTTMDQYLPIFLTDAYSSLENIRVALQYLETVPADKGGLYEAMRLFHSLKSASAMMGFEEMSCLCRDQEEAFKEIHHRSGAIEAAGRSSAVAAIEAIRTQLKEVEVRGPSAIRPAGD
jgi:chemotaxis protein histidine kinase CheA